MTEFLKSINLMDAYGVDYNILTVVTKDTAEHISEIYKEYKPEGGIISNT